MGIVVSAVALALVFRQVDVARTAQILGQATPGWLALTLAFLTADVLIRARRWQRLIAPIHPVGYRPMLGYLLIGYLASNILPARLGELVRSHYLGGREGISRTATLGTVVVERVVDTTMVVAIASVSILVLQVRGLIANAVLVGLAFAGLLIVGLAVGIAAHRLPGADRVRSLFGRWPRLTQLVGNLRGGLSVASRPRTVVEAVTLSALTWTAAVLAFAAAAQSLGIQLTTAQAALLASGVALATAIPAGPGNLGTFDLAAVTIAQAYGILAPSALALALLIHGAIVVVTSVGGAAALVRLGWGRASRRAGEPLPTESATETLPPAT